MCLNIPAVWFVILYKNNLNIDKIQLTLFLRHPRNEFVIPYSRRSFDRGHQRSFKMTGSQVINELWFCAQLRYIILVYSRACDTERLSNFMTSLKGKSEHCGSPGDHIKVFVIQYRKGRGFFLPFFFK